MLNGCVVPSVIIIMCSVPSVQCALLSARECAHNVYSTRKLRKSLVSFSLYQSHFLFLTWISTVFAAAAAVACGRWCYCLSAYVQIVCIIFLLCHISLVNVSWFCHQMCEIMKLKMPKRPDLFRSFFDSSFSYMCVPVHIVLAKRILQWTNYCVHVFSIQKSG